MWSQEELEELRRIENKAKKPAEINFVILSKGEQLILDEIVKLKQKLNVIIAKLNLEGIEIE